MNDDPNVQVNFVHPDGSRETWSANPGESVMDCALDNGVAGIRAQCGGGCTCCTCHCYIDSPWFEALEAPHPDELDLLPYAFEPAGSSRLSCQVRLTPALSGIVVRIPAEQS